MIDIHVHSTYSDGLDDVITLLRESRGTGIRILFYN